MKRISVLLIALLMIAAVLPVNALTKNGSYGEVPLYKGAITIDGKKDAIYDKGLILPIDKYIESTKSESSGKLYILHDGSFLYVLFEAKSAYELTDYNPKYSQKDAYQTTDLPYSNAMIGKVYKIDTSTEPKADPGMMKTKRRYSAGSWSDYTEE